MPTPQLSPTAQLLRRLIRIPSVNPDDDPGTDQTGELALARFLQSHLKTMGAKVFLDNVLPQRPNLRSVFPVPGGRPTYRVLLLPHMDTVSVSGMTVPPFKAEVRSGRIYGRGACDTKGSMAAMLTALSQHLKDNPRGRVEWHFAATMGEESGCQGARELVKRNCRYDLVIAGEPSGNRIVHAHKGCLWMEITSRGKSRHASIASHTDNAIHRLAPFLDDLNGGLDRWLKGFASPLLGRPSLHATTIHGGSKLNISPESCRVMLDIRTVPGMSGKVVMNALKALPSFQKARLKARILLEAPALETDPGHPLLETIRPATRGLTTAPWFCDASIFGERGIPAIALGPGSIKQAHTKDEYISIAELDRGYRCFLNVMQRLETST
jgi:acetylornithine deacetylase/succinyl-diaminopimelate desuccinylase-like protein